MPEQWKIALHRLRWRPTHQRKRRAGSLIQINAQALAWMALPAAPLAHPSITPGSCGLNG